MKDALAPAAANPRSRPMSSRAPHALLLLAASVLLLLWYRTTAAPFTTTTMTTMSDYASQLEVAVRQTDPRKLTLAVTNRGASALTVLTWDTPLDPLALQLGLLQFFAPDPVPYDALQVRRKFPPEADSIATLQPGETRENEVVLRAPIIPVDDLAGKAATVVCQGRWPGVWDAATFRMGDLENLDAAAQGTFEAKLESAQF